MIRFPNLRIPFGLLLLGLVLILTGAAPVGDDHQVAKPAEAASPMVQEILDSHAASRVRVAELTSGLAGLIDQSEILRIEREIEQVKVDAQIEMIRIQVRYARERGDTEMADRMEADIAADSSNNNTGQ
ncbi:MAG: hypothetical protein KAH56_13990 [Candidatus Krumholzibacteria bacterium]|nr:hypothetical protein [Candidatus Krumholzibacteria bacterium]